MDDRLVLDLGVPFLISGMSIAVWNYTDSLSLGIGTACTAMLWCLFQRRKQKLN